MEDAMKKPLVRRVDFDTLKRNAGVKTDKATSAPASASGTGSSPARPRPLVRRTNIEGSGARPGAENASPRTSITPAANSGPVLRRVSKPGQLLIRRGPSGPSTGPQPEGNILRRTAGGKLQLRGKPPQAGAKKVDKRRRRAPKPEDQTEIDEVALENQMNNYISKYIDRPENPLEAVPYEPKDAKVEDLRSDWPNTPLSTTGITESVVQKIEWLARRLPHGYQSPEDIAEHYLKGNLTRFESEEEKQLVLKIASEKSAERSEEMKNKPFPRNPRFRAIENTNFASLQGKESDKNFLLNSSVKGDYLEETQQKYPFLQNAARMLANNGSYGPTQSQKLLDRVQALIPQGRPAAEAKKA